MNEYIHDILPGHIYSFEFTNHRQEQSKRVVIARALRWGTTPWHTELQFFLDGFDIQKQESRSFPLTSIRVASFSRVSDEEVDVMLTKQITDAVQRGRDETPLGPQGED